MATRRVPEHVRSDSEFTAGPEKDWLGRVRVRKLYIPLA
jgi:hypothetical protein